MFHRIKQRLAIEDVDVDVVPFFLEVAVHQINQILHQSSSVRPSASGTIEKV